MELARHFRVPVVLCINRYDLNQEMAEEIRRWCCMKEISVLGEIPYDTRFTEAQTKHRSLVEYSGGRTAQAVESFWRGVLDG